MTPAQRLAETKKRKRQPRNSTTAKRRGAWVCRVRDKRNALDLSLRDVATAVGISYPGLHQIEHGGDPMLTTATKLAAFFGCTITELWPQLNAADGA